MQKIKGKRKLILYGLSGLGVNMLNIVMGSYLCSALLTGGFDTNIESWTFLNKDLVIAGLWAVLVFGAKALDGIIDLPFATMADKMKSPLGRRKTAILVGFVPMIVAYCLFLIPLTKSASYLNTVWFGLLLCAFYTFYTLTMLTYYATFSEVCETEQDTVFLSNAKSVFDVVYYSLGFALLPVFVNIGINIRIVALIFLPLSLTMIIPMFMLKEKATGDNVEKEIRTLTLGRALKTSFKDKPYIYWLFTASALTIGLQLFLGGINEIFSTTGLNMTFVMASSFAPVPLTLILYNKVVKKHGLSTAFRYSLIIFSLGMLIMYICCKIHPSLEKWQLTMIAILGGIFVSFALGSFFSITYSVPTHLAQKEFERSGNGVSSMYFAVEGLFSGIASGIATGLILVTLKNYDVIQLLPLIVIAFSAIAFGMTFGFPKIISKMGKTNEQMPPIAEIKEEQTTAE